MPGKAGKSGAFWRVMYKPHIKTDQAALVLLTLILKLAGHGYMKNRLGMTGYLVKATDESLP